MQNKIERPSAIVCIAYHQMSIMTGIKDPAEPPKVEEINQGNKQNIIKQLFSKTSCLNLKDLSMQNIFYVSQYVTESFRLMLNDLNVRIQLFYEGNHSIFDLFSPYYGHNLYLSSNFYVINMPGKYCFLCASDEGVFLDITADNKQIFHEKFEICSFVQVPTAGQLPTKICHKCAYELDQCSSFVQKYKHATKKTVAHKHCCSLCHEPAKNEFIFDLSKDKNLQHNSFDKIQKVFNYDLEKCKEDYKFICLSCCYTLDVLFDLKNISKETSTKLNDIINEEVNYLTFPRIKTAVVSRKTTITESARTNLYTLQESNSRFTKMTRTRSQNNKLNNNKLNEKSKICDKCHSFVKVGDDMYKIYKTGDTVCRGCWVNMNLDNHEIENQVQQNLAETKLCTVFLKDVLKDTELKEQKLYKINEDDQGNKTYTVTDKNIENENKSDTGGPVTRLGQKRSVRNMKVENKDMSDEPKPNKRFKADVKQVSNVDINESESITEKLKQQKQTTNISVRRSRSNSNSLESKNVGRNERSLTRHKRATGLSLSDADIENKRNRKRLRSILQGISVAKNGYVSDMSSSNEDVTSSKKRIRFTNDFSIMIKTQSEENSKKNTSPRATKNVSNKRSKSSMISTFQENIQSSDSVDTEIVFSGPTYVCDECGASYENKLMGLTHKLTHYKRPKIELQKVSSDIIAKQTSDKSKTIDNQYKHQSETIATSVEDDGEESVTDIKNLDESDIDDKSESSNKEIMEDDVDVELVIKDSDDDCSQKTEDKKKKLQESIHVSTERENMNSDDKQDALLIDVENTQEVKQKENEQCENTKEISVSKVDDEDKKENKDMEEEIARKKSRNTNEEKVIHIGKEIETNGEGDLIKLKLGTNSDNDIASEDKIDLLKEIKQSSVKDNGMENEVNEEKSPEDTQSINSNNGNEEQTVKLNDNVSIKQVVPETVVSLEESSTIGKKDIETDDVSDVSKEERLRSDCINAAAEVLQEVLDLASAEVKKRQEIVNSNTENDSTEAETLENISREIQNSVEIPPPETDNAEN